MADPDSIPIRLRAAPGLPLRLCAADGVELTVPPGLGRKGLTELLNTLLASSDDAIAGDAPPSAKAQRHNFDFTVVTTGELLRTTLLKFLRRRQLGTEKTVELRYGLPSPPPVPEGVLAPAGEWVSSLALRPPPPRGVWGGGGRGDTLLAGVYSGAPLLLTLGVEGGGGKPGESVGGEDYPAADADAAPSPPAIVGSPVSGIAGAHGAPITGVAWLPAGSVDGASTGGSFVTAGADETVRLWSAGTPSTAAATSGDEGAAAATMAAPPKLRGVFRSDDVATAATPFACVAATAAEEPGKPPVVAAGATNGDVWVVATDASRLDDPAPDSDKGDGGDAAGAPAVVGRRGRKRRAAAVPALGGRRLDGGPRHMPISAVAFGAADELAAAAWDGTVRLWAVDTGVVRVTLPAGGKALTALALSPTPATAVATAAAQEPPPPPAPITVMAVTAVDGGLRLLDTRVGSGSVVVGASPPRRGHAGIASAVAWTGPLGVVTGGHDGTVGVWDTRSLTAPLTRLANAAGVGGKVLALAVGGGDGGGGVRRLYSGGSDGQVWSYRLGRAGGVEGKDQPMIM